MSSLFHSYLLRQRGGQEHVFWVACWRLYSGQMYAEWEHQNMGFTVTMCWTTGEISATLQRDQQCKLNNIWHCWSASHPFLLLPVLLPYFDFLTFMAPMLHSFFPNFNFIFLCLECTVFQTLSKSLEVLLKKILKKSLCLIFFSSLCLTAIFLHAYNNLSFPQVPCLWLMWRINVNRQHHFNFLCPEWSWIQKKSDSFSR